MPDPSAAELLAIEYDKTTTYGSKRLGFSLRFTPETVKITQGEKTITLRRIYLQGISDEHHRLEEFEHAAAVEARLQEPGDDEEPEDDDEPPF